MCVEKERVSVCLCVEKESVCVYVSDRETQREREFNSMCYDYFNICFWDIVRGLTVAADGREDHLIHCFKEGEPCAAWREMLAQARQGEQEDDGEAEQQEDDEEKEVDADEEDD